jgi:hypothetical protein
MTSARLPHSETPGSKSGCRLPEEYRRLPRPSSAPDAKASTVRPKKLEHTTTIRNCKTRETPQTPTPDKGAEKNGVSRLRDARVHCTVLKQQPAPPHPPPYRDGSGRPGTQRKQQPLSRHTAREGAGPFSQDPTACPPDHRPGHRRFPSTPGGGGTERAAPGS